jgi:hypothetical protein
MPVSFDENVGRINGRTKNARRKIARLGELHARTAQKKSLLPALLARANRQFQRVLLKNIHLKIKKHRPSDAFM